MSDEIELLEDYEEFVIEHASNKVPDGLGTTWGVLGLVAEAGECAEVVEKAYRKKGEMTDEDFDKLYDELGDVLWYLTFTLRQCDGSLADLIEHNTAKLTERIYGVAKLD